MCFEQLEQCATIDLSHCSLTHRVATNPAQPLRTSSVRTEREPGSLERCNVLRSIICWHNCGFIVHPVQAGSLFLMDDVIYLAATSEKLARAGAAVVVVCEDASRICAMVVIITAARHPARVAIRVVHFGEGGQCAGYAVCEF